MAVIDSGGGLYSWDLGSVIGYVMKHECLRPQRTETPGHKPQIHYECYNISRYLCYGEPDRKVTINPEAYVYCTGGH